MSLSVPPISPRHLSYPAEPAFLARITAMFAQQGLRECWPGLPKFLTVPKQREEGSMQERGQ